MKAIVQDRYGSADILKLQDIDKPVVEDDEVLVRVRAASVHPDVWHVLTGLPYVLRMMGAGLRKPKNPVPGTDVAGIVESVGKNVTRFQPGDEVFGETIRGYQWANGGAYAEYAAAPEHALALKPGGIAVQLAKAIGADVTGVDSTSKLDMVRSLGADRLIDYTQEDLTQRDERYDLIIDIPGNHSLSDCRRALTRQGTYVLIGHDNYGDGMRRWLGLHRQNLPAEQGPRRHPLSARGTGEGKGRHHGQAVKGGTMSGL